MRQVHSEFSTGAQNITENNQLEARMSINVVSQDEESAPPAETGVKTGLFLGGRGSVLTS